MKRQFKKRKLNSGLKKGLMILIPLTTIGLISSCSVKNGIKYNKVECSSDGEYTETIEFVPVDKEYRASNKFIYYGGWYKAGDRYSCDIVEFSARDKTYEDIKPIMNGEKDAAEVLGEPIDFRKETKASVSKEVLDRGAYYSATIYTKGQEVEYFDEDEEKDSSVGKAVLIGSTIAGVTATGALIGWNYYNYKQEQQKKLTLKSKRD